MNKVLLPAAIAHKFHALDSLRGIAAIMVVFQHFWEMNHNADDRLKPWLFFCAGHEAVILFFIMSGFVLSHQLRGFKFENYAGFVFKRVFRIYPAYYFSLMFSAILLIYVQHYYASTLFGDGLKPWFYIWSTTVFDREFLVGALTLLLHEGNSLNLAVWTLYYEMWLSLAFPFLLYLVCRMSYRINVATICLLLVFSVGFYFFGSFIDDQWQSILYYSWYFIFGMLLYQFYPKLKSFSNISTLCLGLALYFNSYLIFGSIGNRLVSEIIIAMGSILILLNAIYHTPTVEFLNNRIFSFYGKISYSFYLLHLPILYTVTYMMLRSNSLVVVKLMAFVVTTIVAYFSYRWIELLGVKYVRFKTNSDK